MTIAAPDPITDTAQGDTLLYLEDVTVSFDGFKALNTLSLAIGKGEMRTVIGPNGAGKTTMMDVITGKTRPDSGRVQFGDRIDLTRLDEASVANLGIGRKFQKPTVFENLMVFENLELALRTNRGTFATLRARLNGAALRKIDDMLTLVGLGDRKARLAGALSHGQKQWLEIGMLLLAEPQLLLLDEPVAGMTDIETEQTAKLFKELAGSHTLVVVEHDMQFVRELGVRVTVLHEGSVLAEGSLDHVQKDQRVVDVYLGR